MGGCGAGCGWSCRHIVTNTRHTDTDTCNICRAEALPAGTHTRARSTVHCRAEALPKPHTRAPAQMYTHIYTHAPPQQDWTPRSPHRGLGWDTTHGELWHQHLFRWFIIILISRSFLQPTPIGRHTKHRQKHTNPPTRRHTDHGPDRDPDPDPHSSTDPTTFLHP